MNVLQRQVDLSKHTVQGSTRCLFFDVVSDPPAVPCITSVLLVLTGFISRCLVRPEVWAASTSPCCPTSPSRSPETTGCCWRVQASRSGGCAVTGVVHQVFVDSLLIVSNAGLPVVPAKMCFLSSSLLHQSRFLYVPPPSTFFPDTTSNMI